MRNPPRARTYAYVAVVIVLLVAGGSGTYLYANHLSVFSKGPTSTITGTSSTSTISNSSAFVNTPCEPTTTSSTTSIPVSAYALVCTNLGMIVIALANYSDVATTVNNFESLATSGFFNDLVWHRIVPGFVIQTGDPTTKNGDGDRTTWGSGTSGKTIPLQIDPRLNNTEGTVAMASPQGGLASSQFFINLVNNADLNGQYAVFGQVISGMSVVQAIASVPTFTSSSSAFYQQPDAPMEAYIVSVSIGNTP